MRAVRLVAAGAPLSVEELPRPEPTGTQVRLRVAGAGVCHTDLHIVDGSEERVELPVTLGHEVAGFVDAAGPDAGVDVAIGSPVLVFGGWGCGECRECRGGNEQRCPRSRAPGFQSDGGYADAMLVPHPRHLVALGDLDPVRAAPLADAAVTPYRAVRRAEPWLVRGARVLVIGAGALGQFALQFLRLLPVDAASLHIDVEEPDGRRRGRALTLGADASFEPAVVDAPADIVLDFVGTDATLSHAADVVTPGGAVIVAGEGGGHLRFGFDRPAVEGWVTTVAWGSRDDLVAVVDLGRRERLRWDVETMPLERAAEAHARLRAGEVEGRLVLVP